MDAAPKLLVALPLFAPPSFAALYPLLLLMATVETASSRFVQ